MNRFFNYVACLGLLFSSAVFAEIVIQKGSVCRDCSTFSEAQKTKIWDLEDIAAEKNAPSIKSIIAYVSTEGGLSDYVLERGLLLAEISIHEKTIDGPWPLTSNEICPANQVCKSVWWQGRWREDETLEPEVIDRFNNHDVSMRPVYNSNVETLGCLGDVPLKYGDVEGDGNNELVIFIEDSLMIFSPRLNRIIFMSMIDVKDWFNQSQTISHLSAHRMDGAPLKSKDPQFQSRSAASVRGGDHSNRPGYRGYAKLFFGDFDENEKGEIIVWRKLYESRLVGDPILGFKKLSDTFAHYKLTGGEYVLQKTESPELREWLSDRELYWSDGFPNLSECESEKEQLIPEMHDPLLNDPDVLPPQNEESPQNNNK